MGIEALPMIIFDGSVCLPSLGQEYFKCQILKHKSYYHRQ